MKEKSFTDKKNLYFRAKKSLGQNFLTFSPILEKIVEAGEITKNNVILEIGPGKGDLTSKILARGARIIAVEKDENLFQHLQKKFAKEIALGSLILIRGDILHFDISKQLKKLSTRPKNSKNYKIIANIPYYITGAILKKFLTEKSQPQSMVLLVQKEVADRIVGRDKESILSISVKAYGTPKIVGGVPAKYFSPKPKVDSAIIKISDISRNMFVENSASEENFWKIVHAGFKHKRKKLEKNLKSAALSKEFMKKLSVLRLGNKRAEDLPISEWILLSQML